LSDNPITDPAPDTGDKRDMTADDNEGDKRAVTTTTTTLAPPTTTTTTVALPPGKHERKIIHL